MSDVVYCPICNNAFADSEVEYIQVGAETRDNPAEYVSRCPFCGATDEGFEEGFECEYCDEMYPDFKLSDLVFRRTHVRRKIKRIYAGAGTSCVEDAQV